MRRIQKLNCKPEPLRLNLRKQSQDGLLIRLTCLSDGSTHQLGALRPFDRSFDSLRTQGRRATFRVTMNGGFPSPSSSPHRGEEILKRCALPHLPYKREEKMRTGVGQLKHDNSHGLWQNTHTIAPERMLLV